MRTIKLEASDGEILKGRLPESWAEVPLLPYSRLAVAAKVLDESKAPIHAFCNDAALTALAELLGVPAEPLVNDWSHLLAIGQDSPWLFLGPLPDVGELLQTFEHQGVTYQHVGDLHDNSAGQLEGLLSISSSVEGNPLQVGHLLLGVLYAPVGTGRQTAASVRASGQAFETLPMSVAWPALAGFLNRSLQYTMPIQRYGVVRPQAEQVVSALEKLVTSPPSASRVPFSNTPRWLLSRLIKRARNQLKTSSLPSASTVGQPG